MSSQESAATETDGNLLLETQRELTQLKEENAKLREEIAKLRDNEQQPIHQEMSLLKRKLTEISENFDRMKKLIRNQGLNANLTLQPNCWDDANCSPNLGISADDGLSIRCSYDDCFGTVHAKMPFSINEVDGAIFTKIDGRKRWDIFYHELKFDETKGCVEFGFMDRIEQKEDIGAAANSQQQQSSSSNNKPKLPQGWYGCVDVGSSFKIYLNLEPDSLKNGDILGCGIICYSKIWSKDKKKTFFFTKNGQLVGPPLYLYPKFATETGTTKFYPFLTINSAGAKVCANFGTNTAKGFALDISGCFEKIQKCKSQLEANCPIEEGISMRFYLN